MGEVWAHFTSEPGMVDIVMDLPKASPKAPLNSVQLLVTLDDTSAANPVVASREEERKGEKVLLFLFQNNLMVSKWL